MATDERLIDVIATVLITVDISDLSDDDDADADAAALQWVEDMVGAEIDNDGTIQEVLAVRLASPPSPER